MQRILIDGIRSQVAVLDVALQQSLPFQKAANAPVRACASRVSSSPVGAFTQRTRAATLAPST